jgi:hypothetical protein
LVKTIYNRFICWARERIQYRSGGASAGATMAGSSP